MAEHVQAPHQGQRLRSDGLVLSLLTDKGHAFQPHAGEQLWRLLPKPQAFWAHSHSVLARPGRWTRTWLGFHPMKSQQPWLRRLEAKDAMRMDL